MKYQIEVKPAALTPEEFDYFNSCWPKHMPTGDTLKETFSDSSAQTLVVFTGPWTAYGMCRDCGDHYIIARYDRYDRIDKNTLEITVDVDDR